MISSQRRGRMRSSSVLFRNAIIPSISSTASEIFLYNIRYFLTSFPAYCETIMLSTLCFTYGPFTRLTVSATYRMRISRIYPKPDLFSVSYSSSYIPFEMFDSHLLQDIKLKWQLQCFQCYPTWLLVNFKIILTCLNVKTFSLFDKMDIMVEYSSSFKSSMFFSVRPPESKSFVILLKRIISRISRVFA